MLDMSEKKEVRWCENRWVRWVYREAEPIFFTQSSAFSGGARSCFVGMNSESLPINLPAERKKFCENINMVVLGIKVESKNPGQFCRQMEKFPFRSAKGLTKQFITLVPTMSRIIKAHLAIQNFSGRYLPHGLDDNQKRFKAGFPTTETEF
jgi:hypothetical protein